MGKWGPLKWRPRVPNLPGRWGPGSPSPSKMGTQVPRSPSSQENGDPGSPFSREDRGPIGKIGTPFSTRYRTESAQLSANETAVTQCKARVIKKLSIACHQITPVQEEGCMSFWHICQCGHDTALIRESVDSLCRDGADAQIYAILKQKPYNFTTNTLKAYLSAQASSLSAFVISKTHISGQKPHGRQLNRKVCGSKSAIFVILLLSFFLSLFLRPSLQCQTGNDNSKTVQALTFILARNGCSSQRTASQPLSVFIASNSPWSIKAIHNTLWLLLVVKDAIF